MADFQTPKPMRSIEKRGVVKWWGEETFLGKVKTLKESTKTQDIWKNYISGRAYITFQKVANLGQGDDSWCKTMHKHDEVSFDPQQQHETLLPHLTSFIAGIKAT